MKEKPVVDQELRSVVREVVLRLDHQDLEHHDRVEGRPPALGAIAMAERRVQLWAEDFKVRHCGERFELVGDVAQPLKTLDLVKQSRCPHHACLPMLPSKSKHSAPGLAR
jgi:hypothetical protein